MTEESLLAWLQRAADPSGRWIGDDAAFLPAGPAWAVSVDHQIAGVHFPADLEPAAIGRRLLAINLSDLAAVGAEPAFAFLALSFPADLDPKPLLRGLLSACRSAGVELAGGDLARAGRLATSLTVLGRRPSGGRWVRRDAGRAGDALYLGGVIGESALGRHLVERGARIRGRKVELPDGLTALPGDPGLAAAARRAVRRHLVPRAQLALGAWLGSRRRAAAIDVSDGVGLDLDRLCRRSGVGAALDAESLPLPARGEDLAAVVGRDLLELALAGGEDYVLLFALPPGDEPPARLRCRRIGELTETPGLVLRRAGETTPLGARGWDHFA